MARQLGGGAHSGLLSLVSRAGEHTLVHCPWLCHCHAARSHAQETNQRHGRVKACSSSCSIRVGCDGVSRPCNGDTAVDATPAQSTIPWHQMGGTTLSGHSCRMGPCRVSRRSRRSSMRGLIVPALILRCSLCRRSVTASGKSLVGMSSGICITHATLTPGHCVRKTEPRPKACRH